MNVGIRLLAADNGNKPNRARSKTTGAPAANALGKDPTLENSSTRKELEALAKDNAQSEKALIKSIESILDKDEIDLELLDQELTKLGSPETDGKNSAYENFSRKAIDKRNPKAFEIICQRAGYDINDMDSLIDPETIIRIGIEGNQEMLESFQKMGRSPRNPEISYIFERTKDNPPLNTVIFLVENNHLAIEKFPKYYGLNFFNNIASGSLEYQFENEKDKRTIPPKLKEYFTKQMLFYGFFFGDPKNMLLLRFLDKEIGFSFDNNYLSLVSLLVSKGWGGVPRNQEAIFLTERGIANHEINILSYLQNQNTYLRDIIKPILGQMLANPSQVNSINLRGINLQAIEDLFTGEEPLDKKLLTPELVAKFNIEGSYGASREFTELLIKSRAQGRLGRDENERGLFRECAVSFNCLDNIAKRYSGAAPSRIDDAAAYNNAKSALNRAFNELITYFPKPLRAPICDTTL